MAKSKPSDQGTKPKPTTRYFLRERPARVTKPSPASNRSQQKKRVHRTRDGLVSLRNTPDQFVSIVETNSLQSPLLRLPGEIRTQIFEYALGGTNILCTYPTGSKQAGTTISVDGILVPWVQKFRSALPCVCRQIYYETATLVYSQNEFHFLDAEHLRTFLRARKRAQLEAIATICLIPEWGRFGNGIDCWNYNFGLLKGLTGLRRLYIAQVYGRWTNRLMLDNFREMKAAVAEGLAGDLEVRVVTLLGLGTGGVCMRIP